MDQFDERGLEGYPTKIGRAVPASSRPRQKQSWSGSLRPPTEKGYDATRWTAPRPARNLDKNLGADVHPDTVYRALKGLEYRWKCQPRVLPRSSD